MENESDSPAKILIEISKLLGIEIRFEPEGKDSQKISPMIDVNSILSKFMALLVYIGWGVPINIMPPYNRVHADVEYWKKQFSSEVLLPSPSKETAPLPSPSKEMAPLPSPSEPIYPAG